MSYLMLKQCTESSIAECYHFFIRHASIKDVGYASEQENKKPKIEGGLIGIKRGVNSRNNFFLILHVVSDIKNELREIFRLQKKETETKYALNQNKIIIQAKNTSLAATYDTVRVKSFRKSFRKSEKSACGLHLKKPD